MGKEEGLNNADSIKLLLDNSVALQKVMADLALNLNKLTDEMSQVMSLFREFSAGVGEEKAVREVERSNNAELIRKLDSLIDQNKHVSKGLILLESTLRSKARENNYF